MSEQGTVEQHEDGGFSERRKLARRAYNVSEAMRSIEDSAGKGRGVNGWEVRSGEVQLPVQGPEDTSSPRDKEYALRQGAFIEEPVANRSTREEALRDGIPEARLEIHKGYKIVASRSTVKDGIETTEKIVSYPYVLGGEKFEDPDKSIVYAIQYTKHTSENRRFIERQEQVDIDGDGSVTVDGTRYEPNDPRAEDIYEGIVTLLKG